jgi:hypothetical protein
MMLATVLFHFVPYLPHRAPRHLTWRAFTSLLRNYFKVTKRRSTLWIITWQALSVRPQAEVDDDPAGLKKQRGKEYLKNLKKWCYEAGAPVGEEEEEDEEFGVGKVGGIAGVGHVANTKAKLKGVAMFKRLGKSGRAAAEAGMTQLTPCVHCKVYPCSPLIHHIADPRSLS